MEMYERKKLYTMEIVEKKKRASNIELLRIISIFLILVTHADFWALGEPTSFEIADNFVPSFTRVFFESLSIICIDIFVLISGWFSIRASLKTIVKLLFQVYFLLLIIFFIYIILGWDTINLRSISECFIFGHEFWFIKAYLGLLILSPVLNAFVSIVPKRVLQVVLVSFYLYQCIYGWITPGASFLHYGYSITSFAGLYLLARYVKLYMVEAKSENDNNKESLLEIKHFSWNGINRSKFFYLNIFLGVTLLDTVLYLLGYWLPFIGLHLRTMTFAISSPLVIFQSLSLLLFFKDLEIKYNPIINFVAASSFSVFILQSSQKAELYSNIINSIYDKYSGLGCLLLILLVIIGYFIVGILLDQIRKFVWGGVENRIPNLKLYE